MILVQSEVHRTAYFEIVFEIVFESCLESLKCRVSNCTSIREISLFSVRVHALNYISRMKFEVLRPIFSRFEVELLKIESLNSTFESHSWNSLSFRTFESCSVLTSYALHHISVHFQHHFYENLFGALIYHFLTGVTGFGENRNNDDVKVEQYFVGFLFVYCRFFCWFFCCSSIHMIFFSKSSFYRLIFWMFFNFVFSLNLFVSNFSTVFLLPTSFGMDWDFCCSFGKGWDFSWNRLVCHLVRRLFYHHHLVGRRAYHHLDCLVDQRIRRLDGRLYRLGLVRCLRFACRIGLVGSGPPFLDPSLRCPVGVWF